jgi:hypothetical protein
MKNALCHLYHGEPRYMYAHCCLELDKLVEAEMALLAEVPEVREKGPTKCRDMLLTTSVRPSLVLCS